SILRVAMSNGISSRQGAHQVAQKLATTTFPRHSDSARDLPCRSMNLAFDNASAFASRPPAPLSATSTPAARAAPPTIPATSRLRRRGFIQSHHHCAHFPQPGALGYAAGDRGLQRESFVARVEN